MSRTPEPLCLGIVGLGGIGSLHAETVRDLDHNVAAGVDIAEDARKKFARTFDAECYESHDQMYQDANLDGVVVTTPNRFHEDATVDALEAGLNVLVEKPLAHTLKSAERIADVANDSDQTCMVGFHNRYSEAVRVLKSLQRDGRLGTVTHVEANYVRRRGIPGRGSWFTDRGAAGGGSLIDLGVHVLDLGLHFLDEPDHVDVLGTTRRNFGNREDYAYHHMWGQEGDPDAFDVDDSASAFLRTDRDQSLSLDVAWATNRPPNHELIVRGTEAGAVLDLEDRTLKLYESEAGPDDHMINSTIDVGEDEPYRAEQTAFLTAIESGDSPSQNTVDQALTVQRIIDGIYRSDKAETAINLDEREKRLV